jgi:REP element-mobilizing transposase RayT
MFVHWTMGISNRRIGWLTQEFHAAFRSTLERNAEHYGVAVPAYCLMPDHLHVLAAGMNHNSDQALWSRAVRRRLNEVLKPFSLQKQAYDHILRTNESGPDAFTALAFYISQNPVRAGHVTASTDWPFVGAKVPALPGLDPRHATFREDWWRYWNSLPG